MSLRELSCARVEISRKRRPSRSRNREGAVRCGSKEHPREERNGACDSGSGGVTWASEGVLRMIGQAAKGISRGRKR